MKRVVLILEVDDMHARLTREGDDTPLVLLRHEVTRMTPAAATRSALWGEAIEAVIQGAMEDTP